MKSQLKTKLSSMVLSLLTAACLLPAHPVSAGTQDGGGGDPCEDRIKTIASDISNWIEKGGSRALTLPAGIDQNTYDKNMTYQISQAKVSCVAPGDKAYPVQVDGTAKTCRFDIKNSGSRITCDLSKFQSLSETDQYVLVHHEYAGLARIENPNNDDSNYFVSNQISGYLVDVLVKRLAVKATSTPPVLDDLNNWKKWQKIEGDERRNIELALKYAYRAVQSTDCKIEMEKFNEGFRVNYSPMNSPVQGFPNIPYGPGGGIMYKNVSNPTIIRQILATGIYQDADELDMRLAVDSIIEMDSSLTKINQVQIIKHEVVPYNAGTASSPQWVSRLVPRRSLTCHAL